MQNKPYLQNSSFTNIHNPIYEVVQFLPSNIHQNTKYPMAKAKLLLLYINIHTNNMLPTTYLHVINK
jgi:hypothetical protein